jgi:hypothetical protein
MPKMDGTGPKGQGSRSGRKLGNCSTLSDEEKQKKLGVGMGKGRQLGKNAGQGKRLQGGK